MPNISSIVFNNCLELPFFETKKLSSNDKTCRRGKQSLFHFQLQRLFHAVKIFLTNHSFILHVFPHLSVEVRWTQVRYKGDLSLCKNAYETFDQCIRLISLKMYPNKPSPQINSLWVSWPMMPTSYVFLYGMIIHGLLNTCFRIVPC